MDYNKFINEYSEEGLSTEEYNDFLEFLNSQSPEVIDALGVILYSYFVEDDETEEDDEDVNYEFTVNDVLEMANAIGPDVINIIDLINDEEDVNYDEIFEYLDSVLLDEVNEAIGRRMKRANMLRTRKFQKLTKAQLRTQAAKRRTLNRKMRHKRRKIYRKNRRRISMYQKSRRDAIKSGKHIVRVRR